MHITLGWAFLAVSSLAAQQTPDWSFVTTQQPRAVAIATAGGHTEVLTIHNMTGGGAYWLAHRHSAQGPEVMPDSHATGPLPGYAVRVLPSDFDPTVPGPELVVVWTSGRVQVWNQQSRGLLRTFAVNLANDVLGAAVGDLDRDGVADLALLTSGALQVVDATGTPRWQHLAHSTGGIAIGQVDGDAQLEIVTGDGRVLDGANRTVQFRWRNGFGPVMALGDVDQDGFDEVVYGHPNYRAHLWAFDLDLGLPKWSLALPENIGRLALADYDRDGVQEAFVVADQWGSVRCFDTATGIQEWSVTNPLYGSFSDSLAVGDFDGDQFDDLILATNGILQMLSGRLRTIGTWGRPVLDFAPPARGDIDGDGVAEIVTATRLTQGSYQGTLFVVDAMTRRLEEHVAAAVLGHQFQNVVDLTLADLDGDRADEVVVAAEQVLVYQRVGAGWVQRLGRPLSAGVPVRVRVADIDPAPGPELIVLSSQFLHVLSYPSGTELWRSLPTGASPRALVITDADGDLDDDLLVLTAAGVLYVWDARTRSTIAALQGPAGRSLRSVAGAAPGILLLGDQQGGLHVAFGGAAFAMLGPFPFASNAIDHIDTIPGLSLILTAAGGQYRIHDGITLAWMGVSGDPLPQPRLLLDLGQPGLFVAGQLGIHLFLPR